jgi:hypothetical protein
MLTRIDPPKAARRSGRGSIVHQTIVANNYVIEDAFTMPSNSTLKVPPAMRSLPEYSCRPPPTDRRSVAAGTGDS